jgi:hypothetical protein
VRLDLGALSADLQEVQGRIEGAFYGTMDACADMTGVPASVMVDRATADKARKLRAQAQAQQAALAGVQQLANTAKTASQIDVGGGQNAVAALLGRGAS